MHSPQSSPSNATFACLEIILIVCSKLFNKTKFLKGWHRTVKVILLQCFQVVIGHHKDLQLWQCGRADGHWNCTQLVARQGKGTQIAKRNPQSVDLQKFYLIYGKFAKMSLSRLTSPQRSIERTCKLERDGENIFYVILYNLFCRKYANYFIGNF